MLLSVLQYSINTIENSENQGSLGALKKSRTCPEYCTQTDIDYELQAVTSAKQVVVNEIPATPGAFSMLFVFFVDLQKRITMPK